MDKLHEIFNNRELAALIWLLILIIGAQFNNAIRKSTGQLLKAFFQPSIIITNLIAILYSIGIVYLLWSQSYWNQSLLKDTTFWFIGSGFLIIMNLNKAGKEKGFFKKMLLDNLKLILLLEFVLNFHEFSFIIEFILLPILAFLAIVQAVAEREERTKIVKTGIEWIFIIYGLVLLSISIRDIFYDINEFANFSTLNSFLLPIILSISFIPCVYMITLYMNYEVFYVRLGILLTNKRDLRYAKWRTFWKCHFSFAKLNKLSPKINTLYNESTREEIKNVIV